ncbi:unnamed protein product [Ilex paraguariensis]|uniref:Fe2OG dioxygenase domain-containing protein n=1 Tax=Ilex paraguariensis TaxID=185542 RepID=A0ABC8R232_9AQUA
MDDEEITELFTDRVQTMRMNYYPPCPQPDMAIGFTSHSDAVALTILFQLNETEGLLIRKDGKWIVNNGLYRSIEHRATVNSTKERLSIAPFYSSNLHSQLGPAPFYITLQFFDKSPLKSI